jgi:hypothetical protein
MDNLVRLGFRPSNLPEKSEDEKRRHIAHVEKVISYTHSSVSVDQERKALDALWRTELLTGKELVMTDQMMRLWLEYGLPSSFVRGIMWPWASEKDAGVGKSDMQTDESSEFSSLIDLDLKRTLPFLGICDHEASMTKCKSVLLKFAKKFPVIGYTQGMSYICTRLMLELNFDESKTFLCLQRIVARSPTISCLYRLNLEEIRATVEFVLDTVAWDNLPSLWLGMKRIKFKPMEYCLIEWIITMFVKNFNMRISGFIFDQFFLSGDVALFRAAIGILSLLGDTLSVYIERNADIEEIKEVLTNANALIGGSENFSNFTKAYTDVMISDNVESLISDVIIHPVY